MKANESIESSGDVCIEPRRLIGLHYSPLPYESTFSALMRLAWLNAFRRRDLVAYLFQEKKPYLKNVNFGSFTWFRNDLVFGNFGWHLPSNIEQNISIKFGMYPKVIWGFDILKFCPICMEAMYHSYWYQLTNQKRCPLHNCQIQDACMCCGASPLPYKFDLSVFNNPYCCHICGNPISGAMPSIEAHEDIRVSYEYIRSAFRGHETWFNRFDPEIYNRAFPSGDTYKWSRWCDIKSIADHYAHVVSDMPSEIAPLPRCDLIELNWCIKMFDSNRKIKRDGLSFGNFGDMLSVQRVFLRHMGKWVFGEVPAAIQEKVRSKFREEIMVRIQDYNPKQLAFLIVESLHDWMTGPRKQFLFPMDSWNNRIPKVAYCAYLYGIYVGLYYFFKFNSRSEDRFWWEIVIFSTSDYFIATCNVSEAGVHSGRVIFPEIPGMPIFLGFGRRGRWRSSLTNGE